VTNTICNMYTINLPYTVMPGGADDGGGASPLGLDLLHWAVGV